MPAAQSIPATEIQLLRRVGVTLEALDEMIHAEDDRRWISASACSGLDPALFFPERGRPIGVARTTCEQCPVKAPCLAASMRHWERFGIWGGLTEKERRTVRRAMVAVRRVHSDHTAA